jgi:membrane fusion protein YbhG
MKASLVVALMLAAACRPSSGTSTATGTLQYVEIDVAPVEAGRVVRVTRREGESVGVGDTLVVITQAAVRPNVDALAARVQTTQAKLRDLLAGSRSTEISRAEADVRGAQSEVDRLNRDVDRLAPLAAHGDIPRQQLDAAQSAARMAAAKRDATQQVVNTLKAGARPEEIDAARAEVSAAQAALRGGAATQADMVLTSPIGGAVITRAVEPGEVVVPGAPTMTVADVTRPFVRVYVNQTLLPLIHVGDTVSAALDAFPDKAFKGRIAAISTRAEFTPRVALTRDERADLVFGVRVEFVDTSAMLKAGLPVTVSFAATGSTGSR